MKKLLSIIALLALGALFAEASFAQATPNKATITFTAPTARADGATITGPLSYNLYQGVGVGASKTKVATISTVSTTISSGLLSGTTYCYQVTAFEGASGPESAMSNESCKTFAASPPGVVTITIQ